MKDIFAQALTLLQRNLVIVIPPLFVAVVSAAIAWVLSASGFASWQFFGDLNAQGSGAFWQFVGTIAALGLRILGALIAIAFTTGMAGAAWQHGRATLADGIQAFRREGLHVLGALALLFLIGLIASALLVPTFGISLLAYMVFMIYTMPAVVVAQRSALDAILESVRVASGHLGGTCLLVFVILAIAVVGGLLGSLAGRIPLLGEAISWIVMEVVVAYATLVVVGEYLKLSSTPSQAS